MNLFYWVSYTLQLTEAESYLTLSCDFTDFQCDHQETDNHQHGERHEYLAEGTVQAHWC